MVLQTQGGCTGKPYDLGRLRQCFRYSAAAAARLRSRWTFSMSLADLARVERLNRSTTSAIDRENEAKPASARRGKASVSAVPSGSTDRT